MRLHLYNGKPLFRVRILAIYECKGSRADVELNCNDNAKSLPEAVAKYSGWKQNSSLLLELKTFTEES